MKVRNIAICPASGLQDHASDELHLVGGGGGSRAILALSGIIYALHKAGLLQNLCTIGGISGGSFGTLMLAAGMSPEEIVRQAIAIDFQGLLTGKPGILRLLYTALFKERFETTRPEQSFYTTEKVGEWIDELVPVWPKKYWTMAIDGATGKHQILFTAQAVFRISESGQVEQISDKPARLSDAIRGSIALPGFIASQNWNGIRLVDGALSWDGTCPIGVPVRHFDLSPNTIVAGYFADHKQPGFLNQLIYWWQDYQRRDYPWSAETRDPARWAKRGTALIHPRFYFPSMKFTFTADEKWEAVIKSFQSTTRALLRTGKINMDKFQQMEQFANNREGFIESFKVL